MHNLRIRILHKLPTPYNDLLFRELSLAPEIDLKVHHLWKHASNRPWSVTLGEGYANRYMRPVAGIDWPFLREAIREKDALFIIGDWAHGPAIAALVVRVLLGYPVSVWADTPQEQLARPWPKRPLRRCFLRWLLRHLDIVFATGVPGVRTVCEMGAISDRVENLPCYVDLTAREKWAATSNSQERRNDLRQLVGCSEDALVVLMSGQCTTKKAFDVGLRAVAKVAERGTAKIGVLVAGTGPELATLKDIAAALGLEGRVAFLGWLNPQQMDDAYGAADVLLHPARYDPFPLVILEAMAWGLVVVGTKVCGSIEDRVDDGRNGFAVPPEDTEAMAAILQSLASDRQRRQEIGAKARLRAEAWPVERGVETIVQAARRVIAERQDR